MGLQVPVPGPWVHCLYQPQADESAIHVLASLSQPTNESVVEGAHVKKGIGYCCADKVDFN